MFHLFLLSVAMGLCLYLFLSLKRYILQVDRRGRKAEDFLSCVLSDQLYWSKQITTDIGIARSDAGQWLKEAWPAALAEGLGEILGVQVAFECLPIETGLPAGSAEDPWWRTELSGTRGAVAYCGCPAQVADRIGGAIVIALHAAGASAQDAKGAFQKVVRESLAAVVQELRRGRKMGETFITGVECHGPTNFDLVLPVKLVFSLQEYGPIWLAVNSEFVSLFAPPEQKASAVSAESSWRERQKMGSTFDSELPVCVSFAHIKTPLIDLIKLTSGSIFELNRPIDEPVELIVNDVIIARGEVVAIEGNCGVRISMIISRREMLQKLG
jgi:flagellar motor switch protein FliN